MAKIQSFSQLARYFSDEAEAYKLVERLRWPDGPVCPHCGVIDHAYYLEPQSEEGTRKTRTGKTSNRRVWKCGDCRKQFSVLVGTIFEDSSIPLSKWLLAIHEMCANKNGVSALELSRKLGITYKSAWFMAHRIRETMKRPPLVDKLTGIVEADETYIGGKAHGKRGRGALNKVPVVTLVERDGEARSQALTPVTSENIDRVLQEHVAPETALMTDSFQVYNLAGKKFASHETVDHGKKEYSRGRVRTNTVEGYFGQLKRSIDGTHYHVSERHLGRYLAEFDYRYTTRKDKDGERTEEAIRRTTERRLKYRTPVSDDGKP